jgi:hypothetical protein
MFDTRWFQLILVIGAGVLIVAVVVAGFVYHPILVHISQLTGTSSSSSRAYNFWSGFGSDIAEVAILGGIIQMYRRHNCHVYRCWRISHHPIPGSPYVCCKKHHPEVPSKAREITQEVIDEACRASSVIHEHPVHASGEDP